MTAVRMPEAVRRSGLLNKASARCLSTRPIAWSICVLTVMTTAGSADPSHNISPLDQKLLDACGIGDFEEAKSLLEQGASVDAVSAVGETALHLSSIHHNMQLAKYLIEKGAALNARASGERSLGMAPLHWFLFMNDCYEGFEALVEKGADVNALCWNEAGHLMSPLDIAEKVNNREREREKLLANGAKRYAAMTQQERAQHAPPPASKPPS